MNLIFQFLIISFLQQSTISLNSDESKNQESGFGPHSDGLRPELRNKLLGSSYHQKVIKSGFIKTGSFNNSPTPASGKAGGAKICQRRVYKTICYRKKFLYRGPGNRTPVNPNPKKELPLLEHKNDKKSTPNPPPVINPIETPKVSPKETPKVSPKENPKVSPKETPKSTPNKVIKKPLKEDLKENFENQYKSLPDSLKSKIDLQFPSFDWDDNSVDDMLSKIKDRIKPHLPEGFDDDFMPNFDIHDGNKSNPIIKESPPTEPKYQLKPPTEKLTPNEPKYQLKPPKEKITPNEPKYDETAPKPGDDDKRCKEGTNFDAPYPYNIVVNRDVKNPPPIGQCTEWADGRYYQITGIHVPFREEAYTWDQKARANSTNWSVSTTPVIPSIVVMQRNAQGASGSTGHVAIAESMIDGKICTSNFNSPNLNSLSYKTIDKGEGVSFLQYIGPPPPPPSSGYKTTKPPSQSPGYKTTKSPSTKYSYKTSPKSSTKYSYKITKPSTKYSYKTTLLKSSNYKL